MPTYLVRACRLLFVRGRGSGSILPGEWRAIAYTGSDWRGAPTLYLVGGLCPAVKVNAPAETTITCCSAVTQGWHWSPQGRRHIWRVSAHSKAKYVTHFLFPASW